MADLSIERQAIADTASQDLSAGALSYTTTIGFDWTVSRIEFSLTVATDQTFTVTKVATTGDDKVLFSRLVENATDVIAPLGMDLNDGDEIKVECTNTGTPSSTVNVTIVGEYQ